MSMRYLQPTVWSFTSKYLLFCFCFPTDHQRALSIAWSFLIMQSPLLITFCELFISYNYIEFFSISNEIWSMFHNSRIRSILTSVYIIRFDSFMSDSSSFFFGMWEIYRFTRLTKCVKFLFDNTSERQIEQYLEYIHGENFLFRVTHEMPVVMDFWLCKWTPFNWGAEKSNRSFDIVKWQYYMCLKKIYTYTFRFGQRQRQLRMNFIWQWAEKIHT